MRKILSIFLALFFLSCGIRVTEGDQDETFSSGTNEGTYSALLLPVNGLLSSQMYGEVRVEKYGDEFRVKIFVNNPPTGKLRQSLHIGVKCPHYGQDINRDGYLDGHEARLQAGSIIIPFDQDLSSQLAGDSLNLRGSYSYARSTSYSLMLSDLHLADEILYDHVVKLSERELTLERRPVIISVTLSHVPTSVSEKDIPLACGVLIKTSDSSGADAGEEALPRSLSDTERHTTKVKNNL
jgi:hypothetical protein